MSTWVIGGSRGIGRAIAEQEVWTKQVVCFSRSGEAPPGCHSMTLDMAGPEEDIESAMLLALDRWGVPDKLVLSAGMGAYYNAYKWTTADLDALWKTNTRGPLLVARRVALMMRQAKGGSILFIGSDIVRRGAAGLELYAATKGAIDAYVKSACRHLAKRGVALNVLNVGWCESEMTSDIEPHLKSAIVKAIPARRMATCGEVAVMAVDILGWGPWATGMSISVAGGA